ncbi:MAG: hypothetical protein IJ220_09005 [Clostridia bacterium]|nr:hypothetical protein [Clostridia bacterium]
MKKLCYKSEDKWGIPRILIPIFLVGSLFFEFPAIIEGKFNLFDYIFSLIFGSLFWIILVYLIILLHKKELKRIKEIKEKQHCWLGFNNVFA